MNPENINKRKSITINQYFSFVSFLNFIAIIFTLIFLFYLTYHSNSFKGNNIDEYSNNYCQNKSNEYYEFLCTTKYYKYNIKKSKFIWIFTDGTAIDQLNILNNFDKYKLASPILISGDEVTYKLTDEMHETLITGKHNKNYKGNEVQGDNIFKQLANAGYKINFRGWSRPVADLVGDKKGGQNENKIFNKKFIDNEHEEIAFSSFCNITNPFPFIKSRYIDYQDSKSDKELNPIIIQKLQNLIESKKKFLFDNLSKTELYEELDEIFSDNNIDLFSLDINDCLKKSFEWDDKENISVVYYTTEVDEFNHRNGKAHIQTILHVYITEKMIEQIIKWIDQHEDYALIITSDHGGQIFFGEETMRQHGIDFPGNEAILFIYTKELKEHYDELKMQKRIIHMFDANEIISQILLNINIPLNSKGFPINLFNDSMNHFIALKAKEIQLIQKIEKYVKKYPIFESELNDLLIGLKDDFSRINYILKEYITNDYDNLEEHLVKKEELKFLLKKNEKFLGQIQYQLLKILYSKDRSILNMIIMSFIIIFLLVKLFFEYRIIIFKFVQHNNFFLSFLLINIYFAFVVLSTIIIWYKTYYRNNLRNPILLYAIYLIFGFVIIVLLNNYFRNRNIYPNNQKIWILIISIIIYSLFCRIISYSIYNFNIKKYFMTCSRLERASINFVTFYFFMFCYIFKEIGRFKKIYINIFSKKICIAPFLIYFFMLFNIFFEDITKENYFKQNSTNQILVIINIACFGISLILSYKFYFEEKIEEITGEVSIAESTNSQNKEKLEIVQSNKNLNNIVINNPLEKNFPQNLVDNEEKNKKTYYTRTKNNFPFMKIYFILIFFWISDESEKLFGLIFIAFLEVLEYLSNYFYKEIKEISRKNKYIKNYNEQNLLIHYYIYYIIIQDMFLISNEITFATTKYSFGFESDKPQGVKAANISKNLYRLIMNIAKYRYNFIIMGFFMKKEINNYYKDKNIFSLDFMARKVILGMRIGLYIHYLFSQILIYMKDELFSDLFVYGLVNFSLYIFDYFFSGIGYIIKR